MSDIQSYSDAGKVAIAKWDEFQHYRDRNPPWVKLHRSLISSETWVCASNEGRVLAIACMMLAAATDNQIPANKRYLRRVAYLDFDPDFEELVSLGFLYWLEKPNEYKAAITPLADASKKLADARPETETETEAETEQSILEPKGSCASDDALTPDEVVEEWNELADSLGLAKVRKLTDTRRRKLKVRLREYPDLEDWQRAFAHIRETPFLHGEGRDGWRADFDFLLQAKSFTKLTEQAYGKD